MKFQSNDYHIEIVMVSIYFVVVVFELWFWEGPCVSYKDQDNSTF